MLMNNNLKQPESVPAQLSGFENCNRYRIPLMANPPKLDGFVTPRKWSLCAGFDGHSLWKGGGQIEERAVCAYVGATRTHFCFAMISEMPPVGQLVCDVKHATGRLAYDDSVEVYIDPTPGSIDGVTYHILFNSAGVTAYEALPRGRVRPESVYSWRGDCRLASGFHDDRWHCEIAIPIESMCPGRSSIDGKWGINFCRSFKQPWLFTSLNPRVYEPGSEVVFEFAEDNCAAIQLRHETDPTSRNIDVRLSLHNPGPRSLAMSACLYLKRDRMPEMLVDDELQIGPGQTCALKLQVQETLSKQFELYAVVRNQAGALQYTRTQKWGPPRARRWDTVEQQRRAVDFRFAYYPYRHKLRIQADISGLPAKSKLTEMKFVIRSVHLQTAIAELLVPIQSFCGGLSEMDLQVPALDGHYEIVAFPQIDGTLAEPIVKKFDRLRYDWEHLNLGKSRKVYSPFTPVKVEGLRVTTVMKEYELNGCGLMQRARSTDQQQLSTEDILAGPMTFIATIDGQSHNAKTGQPALLDYADDEVRFQCTSSCGQLVLDSLVTIEYDGLFKVDLTLRAEEPVRADTLDLLIPIRADVATMMHAMSDGSRYTVFTGPLPDQQGQLWSAAALRTSEWPSNFCTYVFLGNHLRGLCWFTENDRGWSWDPKTTNLEIIRSGEQVLLKIHLVSRPFVLDAPRKITFGMMASPVKPRLEGWRHRWFTDNYTVYGCDRHWFSLGICGSVYPAGKDLWLWEEIKRSRSEKLSDAEVEAVVARGKTYFEPHGVENVAEFTDFAQKNLRNRFGKTPIFYYNRSTSGCTEEYHTFLDEWCLQDFNDRDNHKVYELAIAPSDSYIDFALYWYGKSFDVAGNTGLYIDNYTFHSSTNREMTAAYQQPDGSIMPSNGIWHLRELAKRSFVFMCERGMEPMHMVHMTSHLALPIVSFHTVQYDWEWHFSQGDVHDRFGRDYIALLTNGDHCGAWPVVLHDNGKLKHDEWCLRTYMGVCLVHELIMDRYLWHDAPISDDGDSPENRLYRTYRLPINDICRHVDVEVFRYWDSRPQPVSSDDPDLPVIVYVRKGVEAIVVLTNYGKTDKSVHLRISSPELGLGSDYTATDLETHETSKVRGDNIEFTLGKHDLKAFRLTATKLSEEPSDKAR